MARGYHRLSFRARHILRQFGKAKNITLQRLHLHELRHAISRKHRFKGPKGKPALGKPGLYQRLSRKGRKLISRLRHSRSWSVQKQTVNELEREVQRGERIALAKVKRGERRNERAARLAARTKERGQKFRKWVQDKHEPHLARAERRHERRKTMGRQPYRGPFSSERAHRRWGNQNARREVPGVFARFAARRGWTRLQPGHRWTPAARRAEARAKTATQGRPAPAPAPGSRGRLAPGAPRTIPAPRTRPAPARTR